MSWSSTRGCAGPDSRSSTSSRAAKATPGGVVEFRAHWRDGAETGVLAERSRFVRQSGRWWYLDGKVS